MPWGCLEKEGKEGGEPTHENPASLVQVRVAEFAWNYLQRQELFEKAIEAYNEALRWNPLDVRSLLGRSVARSKVTYYNEALADAAKAAEIQPNNIRVKEIRAQTEYEKCAFEKALVLAHRGMRERYRPPHFAECVSQADKTVEECAGKSAAKVLVSAAKLIRQVELKRDSVDSNSIKVAKRRGRLEMARSTDATAEMSRAEKQRADRIFHMMSSKYLERMAHEKYFLMALSKDERLESANKKGSDELKKLAKNALKDIEKRQAVLRERRPLYAALAAESAARKRLAQSRKTQLKRTQRQNIADAKRLIKTAEKLQESQDTAKCLEHVEFALEQISRKPNALLPGKEKFLTQLRDVMANSFLDQKRVKELMSEADRDKRAFVLLGIQVSREPSRDSVLRVRPEAPRRDAKMRLRTLERQLKTSTRPSERCYLLHELARLNLDAKQGPKALYYAAKCLSEARKSSERIWVLNSLFLLSRSHILQNNRTEARANLLEAATLSRAQGFKEVADFFDTCVEVSVEGEVPSTEVIEKREKEMVGLMQDEDMRSAATHLFRKMSVLPVARRFSVLPGSRMEENTHMKPSGRRASIMPKAQQPTTISRKNKYPLGWQNFDD